MCKSEASNILGVSKGGISTEKDPTWWNEEVKEAVKIKRELFKLWQLTKLDVDKMEYIKAKKSAKQKVAQSIANSKEQFYRRLEDAKTDVEVFRIAKQRHKTSLDIKRSWYEIPADLWKKMGPIGWEWLARLFNVILATTKIPNSWRQSFLIPFFKNKGDVSVCGNYRGIKLTSHTLKVWERIINNRLITLVDVSVNQFGFTATRMPIKTKGKVYKTEIRPALTYGAECWALKKVHEQKVHTNEMRMLRWAAGVTRLDKVRNEHIRGSFKIAPITEKLSEQRLRWYGHIMRRGDDHVVKKALALQETKRGPGRRPATWWSTVSKDLERAQLNPQTTQDRRSWRMRTRRADP
ncbi:uncharacterized protein LOC134744947, partial [Cydia strobilella]|uniref:uncharacterized protein LOC134744947 n=1 Tax=Cydia strobilella TaxID=1100964 RepID=UPI0030068D62